MYRVTISSGAVTDTATPPVAFPGLACTTYQFTTGPTITTYNPAKGATNMPTGGTITLTFSAPVPKSIST